ncbi:MAG: hypothetical protein ACOC46_02690, partial [Pirellulales bacterium]
MYAPGLIVFEGSGRLAALMQRELAAQDESVLVRETRTAGDCLTAVAGLPGSVVLVEMGQDPPAELE